MNWSRFVWGGLVLGALSVIIVFIAFTFLPEGQSYSLQTKIVGGLIFFIIFFIMGSSFGWVKSTDSQIRTNIMFLYFKDPVFWIVIVIGAIIYFLLTYFLLGDVGGGEWLLYEMILFFVAVLIGGWIYRAIRKPKIKTFS